MKPIEIVLTGGPSAGKTTGLAHLVDHLGGRGWRVLVVPEVASLVIAGGVADIGRLAAEDRPRYLAVQERITRMQWSLRAHFLQLSADLGDDKVVILHDRGIIDNGAYMDADEFAGVVDRALGRAPAEVAACYDAVIHLTTAADGAAYAYTLDNNAARTEDPAAAIQVDRLVRDAWLGHPHFIVIGNRPGCGFDAKLARLTAAVLGILGEPEPVEIERKWLLAAAPPADVLAGAVPVDIVQFYLEPDVDGAERRVRERIQDGHASYFLTTKTAVPGDASQRIEHESSIDAETYHRLVAEAGGHPWPIIKRRWCFVHDGQHFEADHITMPIEAWLLEAELVMPGEDVTLPPMLDVDREVTDDPNWRNAVIARGGTR